MSVSGTLDFAIVVAHTYRNMNEDVIADLKQFITTTVRQETASLATKDDLARLDVKIDGVEQRLTAKIDGLEQRLGGLEKKVDQIQAAIGEAMSNETERVDTRLDDHDRRLRRLEHRAA